MTSDLRNLYQEMIVDHSKRPRNFKKLSDFTHTMEGFNPLCGDRLNLYLKIQNDIIMDVAFEGQGCAISTASASMMTEALKGKNTNTAQSIFSAFHEMLVEGHEISDDSKLGKLSIFAGVHEYPARVKCASLAWHTLNAVLEKKGDPTPVKTE